ncbi:uncharacterized protein AdoR isoform X2 [Penaeus vannamei]|uniref:uncharacterized protein AdoR isoform X2 n=1 Tax=Penaeus vannamei TaxID=6689 RepID=UPI00387F5458
MSVEIGNLSITTPLTAEGFTTPYPHSLTSTPEPVLLSSEPEEWKLDWTYTVTEILVAVVAVIGNALTVTVFAVDRKLRRLTNYYIVALAVADFLVGVLGIPFAILTSIGLPKPLWPCLLMLSTLLVLCTTSIFCLVAVSVDRYWAILYPLRYSRVMTAKIARYIILMCWLAGTFIGLLPLMGWHVDYNGTCVFTKVMNYNYLVFLYFFTIVGPGILMAVFYTHIYTVVLKQLRQIAAQEPQAESGSLAGQSSQKQRPRFLMSRSQSRQMGDNARLDSRRSSTTTNIVNQLQIPRSSQAWQLRELLQPLPQSSHTGHLAGCASSLSVSLDPLPAHHSPSHRSPSSPSPPSSHHSPRNPHPPAMNLHNLRDNLHCLKRPSLTEVKLTQSLQKGKGKRKGDGADPSQDTEHDESEEGKATATETLQWSSVYRHRTPNIKISREQELEEEVMQLLVHELNKPIVEQSRWKGLMNIFSHEEAWSRRGSRRGSGAESRRGSTLSHFLFQVGHANRREVKAAKSLSIIVLFFMFSWFPLYTINCVQAFCHSCTVPPFIMNVTIILSHLNSAINPLLYAYHMKDFRMAIKMFTLHRILRRPLPHDYVFNRSLVSPHHSTLYRVSVGGALQNTNLHTPHAHNTPMTGSPSPLIGTPKGGQRSRTSTVGSCNPWTPSRGLSPSPSSPRNRTEPPSTAASGSSDLLRPRSATITTHTAPASALKSSNPTKPGSPPQIQSGPTVAQIKSRRQVSTLPPALLIAASERLVYKPCSPDAVGLQSGNTSPHASDPKTGSNSKENSKLDSGMSTVSRPDTEVTAEKSCTREESQGIRSQLESKSQRNEIKNTTLSSEAPHKKDSVEAQTNQEQLSDIIIDLNADTKSQKNYEKVMQVSEETELDPLGHGTPPLPNGSACSAQGETVCTNHQADEPTQRREELRSLFDSSAQCVRPQTREDLDPRPAGQKLGESRLSREFYKYIPKILRRTQGQLKSKSSKNTRSWWPELMKQRSYHDLPGVKSSEQVRRTWSASSAMEG